jgi:osmotically-inducible protein OsmY
MCLLRLDPENAAELGLCSRGGHRIATAKSHSLRGKDLAAANSGSVSALRFGERLRAAVGSERTPAKGGAMRRRTDQKSLWLGGGALLGAGLMALLDPERGRRRRALLRDKAIRAAHTMEDAAGTTWRDLSHRAVGVASEVRRIARGEQVADDVLTERVRSKIGRLVSHPASIEVSAKGGEVTLAGPVLQRELDGLLHGVRCVRGLTRLDDRLEVHEQAGSVPGLQGPGSAREPRFELLQENWSPTARLLAGLAGVGLAGLGARRRGGLGAGLGALGSGILLRAVTNLPFRRLASLGSARRGIDIGPEPPLEPRETEARGVDVAHEEIVREEPAAETPAPPRRRRPTATRGGSREPAPGGDGQTKGIILKEE